MKQRITYVVFCLGAISLLILDTQTAIHGAAEGIELCMKVLLPSLFPFFLIINYANSVLTGFKIPILRSVGRSLQLPDGCESILLLSLLGGYPVGAQLIGDLYRKGQLSKRTCRILLGYFNNAGPAFIFGITGLLFSHPYFPALLWGIHIISALITGHILPKPKQGEEIQQNQASISIVKSMQHSIRICAAVCGWVIMFKTIQAYIFKWLIYDSDSYLSLIIRGILELSTGCIGLLEFTSEPLRFLLVSAFLAFGGICVILQTASVTESLGMGLYIPGKFIQTAISLIIATIFFIHQIRLTLALSIIIPSLIVIFVTSLIVKKRCGNPAYNHV